MSDLLNKNLFFVKEHVGLFKAANNFDIYDPQTQQMILECREDSLGIISKIFRFTRYKRMTPFDIAVRAPGGSTLVRVARGVSFYLSTVDVFDGAPGKTLGFFKQKSFTIGGSFDVYNAAGTLAFSLMGKWTGWEFKFLAGDRELAKVSKKWAGIGKELFTTADNYMLEISSSVPANDPVRPLILAAVLCIDMVLKE